MSLSIPSIIVLSVDGLENPVSIPGITQGALELAPETNAEATAGSPYAQTVHTRTIRPEFTFTSYCLDKVLSAIGLTGLSLKTTSPKTGLTLYLLKQDSDCGRIETGNVHSVLRFTSGCGFLSRISCNPGEDATAEVRFMILSADGVTAPITRTDSLAPPAQVAETRFGLGPLKVAGTTIGNLTTASIDFGINAESILHDSDVYPTTIFTPEILPVIDGTTQDTSKIGTGAGQFGIGGAAVANTTSELFFRKRASGGALYVDEAELEHIKLAPTGAFHWTTLASASANRPHEHSFRITTGQASNGDVPIVLSTAAAIASS